MRPSKIAVNPGKIREFPASTTDQWRIWLEDDREIVVVGEADDGQQAIDLALQLRPTVVVMDFELPAVNGATATRQILRGAPDTAVLMLSMHSQMSYVRASFDSGARGYLLKNAMDLELVDAIRKVAGGRLVLDPDSERSKGSIARRGRS
jgi:DNA-binding NarL/FixJ family response regulator